MTVFNRLDPRLEQLRVDGIRYLRIHHDCTGFEDFINKAIEEGRSAEDTAILLADKRIYALMSQGYSRGSAEARIAEIDTKHYKKILLEDSADKVAPPIDVEQVRRESILDLARHHNCVGFEGFLEESIELGRTARQALITIQERRIAQLCKQGIPRLEAQKQIEQEDAEVRQANGIAW